MALQSKNRSDFPPHFHCGPINSYILRSRAHYGDALDEEEILPPFPDTLQYVLIKNTWSALDRRDSNVPEEMLVKAIDRDIRRALLSTDISWPASSLSMLMEAYPGTIPYILESLEDTWDFESYVEVIKLTDSLLSQSWYIMDASIDEERYEFTDPRPKIKLDDALLERINRQWHRTAEAYIGWFENMLASVDEEDPPNAGLIRGFFRYSEAIRSDGRALQGFLEVLNRKSSDLDEFISVEPGLLMDILSFLERLRIGDTFHFKDLLVGILTRNILRSDRLLKNELLHILHRTGALIDRKVFYRYMDLIEDALRSGDDDLQMKFMDLVFRIMLEEVRMGAELEEVITHLGKLGDMAVERVMKNPARDPRITKLFLSSGRYRESMLKEILRPPDLFPPGYWASFVFKLADGGYLSLEDAMRVHPEKVEYKVRNVVKIKGVSIPRSERKEGSVMDALRDGLLEMLRYSSDEDFPYAERHARKYGGMLQLDMEDYIQSRHRKIREKNGKEAWLQRLREAESTVDVVNIMLFGDRSVFDEAFQVLISKLKWYDTTGMEMALGELEKVDCLRSIELVERILVETEPPSVYERELLGTIEGKIEDIEGDEDLVRECLSRYSELLNRRRERLGGTYR